MLVILITNQKNIRGVLRELKRTEDIVNITEYYKYPKTLNEECNAT